MESAPAVFAGATFALVGAGLLLWTSVRVRLREPVADGVDQTVAAAVTTLFGVALLVAGAWLFTLL
ncbi:hypothetical protein V1L54_18665 [Streptomyces sp. TRM 70361]|uniref:hypothetical protein n=1 Tax=Streptomyces sp. TRM 70361 TaxID=3116553 RepID=UPI002E7B8B24|nr:hypothetical protein [Streptomyces sp. TRM 70361]MEE1941404.1 hypothetical protein [Streptomyces sp. TRM 70361]